MQTLFRYRAHGNVASFSLLAIWLSSIGGFIFLPLFTGVLLALQIVVGVVWLYGTPTRAQLPHRAAWLVGCIALLLSVPITRWPLRLVFAISQPQLDAIADRIERGEKLHYPLRAGLLVVKRGEMGDLDTAGRMPKAPVLWLDDQGTDQFTGLVRGSYREGGYACYEISRLTDRWEQEDID